MASFIGERFGRLIVKAAFGSYQGRRQWSCICDCGGRSIVSTRDLRLGRVTSCGCAKTKHGHSRGNHPLYQVWLEMRNRCSNPAHKSYYRYGGRGIKVDPRWNDFEVFLADMGPRPDGYSLDRINNDLGYSPGNCKWSTAQEQVLNSSRPKWITVNGVTKHITAWAKDLNIRPSAITQRINTYGWSKERACTTPGRKTSRSLPELDHDTP